jgi:hypothetical protein
VSESQECRAPTPAYFYGLSLLRIEDEDDGWIRFYFEGGYSVHIPKLPDTGVLYVHGTGE